MAYPVIMYPGFGNDYYDLMNHADLNKITSATVEFILNECFIPDKVNVNEVFDLKITYRVCTIEERNPEGVLDNFDPIYDGIYFYKFGIFPQAIRYWLWRLSELVFLPPSGAGAIHHGRAKFAASTKFVYTFHGTIEELLGWKPTQSQSVDIVGKLYASHYGWYEPSDRWPYNWNPPINFFELTPDPAVVINKTILVTMPSPPPYPIFNIDLCSVSKATVAPNEKFDIKVTLENQNEGSGNYSISCYCEGNYTELAVGTIGGYKTKSHTFNVTANQLAQRSIINSQYLAFTVAVFNDEGETDRWTPAAIAVIVTEPPETASLSGRVADKQTGAGMAGVSITALGYSASTDSAGYYTLDGLAVGPCDVKFSKAGYWDQTKSITLRTGENTLNITMAPTTEPPPSETPWGLIGLGAAAIVGLGIILSRIKGDRKR